MFFILSKILAFAISPLTWIILLLLLALFTKDQRKKNKYLFTMLFILVFFSNSFILDEVMRKWEIKAITDSEVQNYDVGIVLGGMSSYDKHIDRITFYQGVDRLLQAVTLYNKGLIKKILISGGSGSILEPENREAIPLKRFLLSLHIPENAIIIESYSRNTHENARYTADVLQKIYPKGGKFLLITSGSHLRRAIKCFEKENLKVTPFSTDRYSGKRKFIFDHLFVPDLHTLHSWDILLHEWLCMLSYKVSGYI
jgi:uncharacterized SAM-binding protein YcdF (DUF218 family)